PRLVRPRNHEHEQWLRDMQAGKQPPAVRTMSMERLVAELLGRQSQQQQPKDGRPHRAANKASDIEQAERNAAWRVAYIRQGWRSHHGRKRVPDREVTKMIREAAREAAKVFRVRPDAISESNIRNLLKSGRVVVR